MSACAVIFDFDGVIANTEAIHLQGYNHALSTAEKAIGRKIYVTPESYGSRYIVYGSRDGFIHMLSDAGIIPQEDITRLKEQGIAAVFLPGTSTEEIVKFLNDTVRPRA